MISLVRMDEESNSGFWSFVRSLRPSSAHQESNLTIVGHHPHHNHHHQLNPDHNIIPNTRRPTKRVRFSDTSAENDGDLETTTCVLEGQSNDELCPATDPVTVGWRSSPFYRDRKRSHYSAMTSLNIPTFSKFNWSSRRVF